MHNMSPACVSENIHTEDVSDDIVIVNVILLNTSDQLVFNKDFKCKS